MRKVSKNKAAVPTRGIMMFAHNNIEIDYMRLAIVNAFLIQKHLKLTADQITIVTDPASFQYATETLGQEKIDAACANYIIVEKDIEFKNKNIRIYKDTSHTPKQLPFYNVNRADAYDLSPYDETILIDCDYLVLSDALNNCWGHNNDLMMNWRFNDIMFGRQFEVTRFAPLGITMYWATVIYFRKTPYAESLFEIVKHYRENRHYYNDLYNVPGSLFRNDFAFSIAAHTLAGYQDQGLQQLPMPALYKTFDLDDIHRVEKDGSLILFVEKPDCPGDYILVRWKGVDLHVMNKWAINRISEGLMEYALDGREIKKAKAKATRKPRATKAEGEKKAKKPTRVRKKKVAQSDTIERED